MDYSNILKLSNAALNTRIGQVVTVMAILADCEIAQKKTKEDYLKLTLMDKNDNLIAQKWSVAGINVEALKEQVGNLFLFSGIVKAYSGSPYGVSFHIDEIEQLTEASIQAYRLNNISIEDFYNVVANREELARTLTNTLNSISKTYYGKITTQVLKNNWDVFKHVAAGKSLHHSCVGGLLQHTVEVLTLAMNMAQTAAQFGYTEICYPLVIAGAIVHDIGKVKELKTEASGTSSYTDESILATHSIAGIALVTEAATQISLQNTRECEEICHIISAHHGRVDWGQLKEAAMIEAVFVQHADHVSSCINATHKGLTMAQKGEQYQANHQSWLKSMGCTNDELNI